MKRHVVFVMLLVCLGLGPSALTAAGQQKPAQKTPAVARPMARIIWLEPTADPKPASDGMPRYKPIPASDPRLKDYEKWIDTEGGRFARRLVFAASKRFGIDPAFGEPVLPIVVKKGGNHGEFALAIETPGGLERHPKLAYVVLDPSPSYLGDTILHESGHVAHSIAVGARGGGSVWSAFPHTTFATSDPSTALAEGYGIHLETLWGHFGKDAAKRAYYRRLTPSFEPGAGRKAEFFSPITDLMTFAQTWARYEGVRDGMAAFEGHVYPDAYPRTQMDPSRDRASLKTPNAMLASEGVAASVFFWTTVAIASENGARPEDGLDQPALIDAELRLLEALASLPPPTLRPFRPDILDVVDALARNDAHLGAIAVARFVDITRGVTARPALRARWRALYTKAIMLDINEARAEIGRLDAERGEIVKQAQQDRGVLRAGVGPVLPVRAQGAEFEMKALGEKLTIEFDLNAVSAPELAVLSRLDATSRARIERERETAPFASLADFTARTGLSLQQIGVEAVPLRQERTER